MFRDRPLLRGLLLAALVCSGNQSIAASPCENDVEAYLRVADRAQRDDDLAGAAQSLQRAAATGCADAAVFHALGRARQQMGDFEQALSAFETAQSMATDGNAQALSIARYGEVLSQRGMREEALDLLQFARNLHTDSPEWVDELAKQIDLSLAEKPFSRDSVKRAFSNSQMGMMTPASIARAGPPAGESTTPSSSAAQPSLPFRINFAFDSSEVDAGEAPKVSELAQGLLEVGGAGRRFLLVGHTDARGSPSHNQRLSERRAEAVYRMVVEQEPSLASKLRFAGRGASQPLYDNAQSEAEHRLNRRVQVVLVTD